MSRRAATRLRSVFLFVSAFAGAAQLSRRASGSLLPPAPLFGAGVLARTKGHGTQAYRHRLPLGFARQHAGREEGTGPYQHIAVRSGAGYPCAAVRDREVIGRIVAEVTGEEVAAANACASAKVQRQIVRDCLAGTGGRAKVDRWVPRWMTFPPSAYTERGGVGSADRWDRVAALRDQPSEEAGVALESADETSALEAA